MDGNDGNGSHETFGEFVEREKTRIAGERETLVTQRSEIDERISGLDRELSAIDAFEAVKEGRMEPARSTGRGNRGAGRGRSASQAVARRGSKRDALLKVIRDNPDGLRRAQIIEKMNLKGDKSGEMSVSNALTALVKSNQIHREGGKYLAN